MLLQALVACAGVTLRAVATSLGIDVAGGTVSAEGDLDIRTLAGYEDRYRLRVGDYRVIYEVIDGQLIVLVVGVGHRREIYQAMS